MTELPLLEIAPKKLWAWADAHLREDSPAEILAFAQSLQSVPADVDCVMILGDLFDAWIGSETWSQPIFSPLKDAFLALADRKIQVILFRGNRDVLMEPKDAHCVGAQLADRVLFMGEGAILFSHGDEYCLNDLAYQKLRRALRRPILRKTLRILPLWIRKRIAARMRRHSQQAVGRKPLDALALDLSAVDLALDEVGAGRAVIGHLHAAQLQKLVSDRQFEVLAAWSPGAQPWTSAK